MGNMGDMGLPLMSRSVIHKCKTHSDTHWFTVMWSTVVEFRPNRESYERTRDICIVEEREREKKRNEEKRRVQLDDVESRVGVEGRSLVRLHAARTPGAPSNRFIGHPVHPV